MFGLFKRKPKAPTLSKQASTAIEVATGTLQMQIMLGCVTAKEFEHDDYALGYVFGFSDGILQMLGVNDDLQCMAAFASIFSVLFEHSSNHGADLLGRAMSLQGTQPFAKGMSAGGNEAFAFLKEKSSPMGLSTHFHERTKS